VQLLVPYMCASCAATATTAICKSCQILTLPSISALRAAVACSSAAQPCSSVHACMAGHKKWQSGVRCARPPASMCSPKQDSWQGQHELELLPCTGHRQHQHQPGP
jgi:hypothetical protein